MASRGLAAGDCTFHTICQGSTIPADNPNSTPVAGNHRAPKPLEHAALRADAARLTPVACVECGWYD